MYLSYEASVNDRYSRLGVYSFSDHAALVIASFLFFFRVERYRDEAVNVTEGRGIFQAFPGFSSEEDAVILTALVFQPVDKVLHTSSFAKEKLCSHHIKRHLSEEATGEGVQWIEFVTSFRQEITA